MKNIIIVISIIAGIFLFMTYEDTIQDEHTDTTEMPKKDYLDSPTNTYKQQVEALSISNTIQHPVNSYINSRIDTRDLSKKSVDKANKQMDEQNKAMEALIK